MKNIKFNELVELFQEEKKNNLEIVKQAIRDNQEMATQEITRLDRACYEEVYNYTEPLEADTRALALSLNELQELQEEHLSNKELGFTAIDFNHDVEAWADGSEVEVEGVCTNFIVSSIKALDLKGITDLEEYSVKSDFRGFVGRYTNPNTSGSWNTEPECKVLEMYREGLIDLKTVATLTYGSCNL